MKIVNTYQEGEYTINVYENGTREKYLTDHPPRTVQPPLLTEEQELAREIYTSLEALLTLAELSMG